MRILSKQVFLLDVKFRIENKRTIYNPQTIEDKLTKRSSRRDNSKSSTSSHWRRTPCRGWEESAERAEGWLWVTRTFGTQSTSSLLGVVSDDSQDSQNGNHTTEQNGNDHSSDFLREGLLGATVLGHEVTNSGLGIDILSGIHINALDLLPTIHEESKDLQFLPLLILVPLDGYFFALAHLIEKKSVHFLSKHE